MRVTFESLRASALFAPRLRLKPLAALCRRSAMALSAGIDLRTVWAREATQARSRAARQRLSAVSQAINRGESLTAALTRTGDFFPPLFCEMTEVGEQSGHLSEVFGQLAEHYETQLQLRRTFLASIAWPLVELALALSVIGLLIWVLGFLREATGTTIDILGFGLLGNAGLAIYLALLATAGAGLFVTIRAASRGVFWTRPIQRGVLRLPVVGPALETLALARMAWSMYLTMNAGMEVRRALRVSLRSTRNARYLDQLEPIDAEIAAGNSIYEAFSAADCFPPEFLETVAVGEQSGRLVESMAHLSRQYHDQARAALSTLATLAGVAVWVVVATFIIALIFRVFSFYLGALKSAMQ
jgi:type II secretory pathway component PulF